MISVLFVLQGVVGPRGDTGPAGPPGPPVSTFSVPHDQFHRPGCPTAVSQSPLCHL